MHDTYKVYVLTDDRNKMKDLKKIMDIINMSTPVNTGSEIVDIADAVVVFTDGRFSNHRRTILFTRRYGFIMFEESDWQGEGSSYSSLTPGDVMNLLLAQKEAGHFDRFIEGIRKVFAAPLGR